VPFLEEPARHPSGDAPTTSTRCTRRMKNTCRTEALQRVPVSFRRTLFPNVSSRLHNR
jgi:hypothetical protein